VIHHRECLTFGLESRHDLRGIHAGFDDLDGDAAVHGLDLFCQPYLAHAALPDSLQQVVGAKPEGLGHDPGVFVVGGS
jgi:hypothetical protein